jgi:hypothetical protein
MVEYILSKGTIEVNNEFEVIGVCVAYIHLLGMDISDVVRRKEARGIRRVAEPYPETRLSNMQRQERAFRIYGKGLLRERQSTSG